MAFKDWHPEKVIEQTQLEVDASFVRSPEPKHTLAATSTPTPTSNPHYDINDDEARAKASEQLAERRLREAAAFAAEAVVFLALHSESEDMRFKASNSILDRSLGKPDSVPSRYRSTTNESAHESKKGTGSHRLEDFLSDIVTSGTN